MSKSGTTIRYEYNHDGLRTQKFVDTNNKTDATYYTYNGKNIIHVIKNSDHLHIFYDAQNRPAKVSHNGIFYTYLYNLQGDVIGLLDKNGVLVVEYKYDAWGKPLSITGTLANTLGKLNPFRYRGYVYDDETGLYYLHSRYYNPETGRFINADASQYVCEGMMINNLFAYCSNSPVIHEDKDGDFFDISIGFIETVVATVSSTIVADIAGVGAAVAKFATVVTAIVSSPIVPTIVLSAVAVAGIAVCAVRTVEAIEQRRQNVSVASSTAASASVSSRVQDKPKYHLHHIVAKADGRAWPARRVLEIYGYDPNTYYLNLVKVSAEQHMHLHTNVYYMYVNTRIYQAGRAGRNALNRELAKLAVEIRTGIIMR